MDRSYLNSGKPKKKKRKFVYKGKTYQFSDIVWQQGGKGSGHWGHGGRPGQEGGSTKGSKKKRSMDDYSPMKADRGFQREDTSIEDAMEGFDMEDLLDDFMSEGRNLPSWRNAKEIEGGAEVRTKGKQSLKDARGEAERVLKLLGYNKGKTTIRELSGRSQQENKTLFSHPEFGIASITQLINASDPFLEAWTTVKFGL